MELSFEELVKGLGGKILIESQKKRFNEISTDTRKLERGNVFLALKGDNFNGNKYVIEAAQKGASIIVIDQVLVDLEKVSGLATVIKVDDGNGALLSLAKFYRKKLGLKVIGVTGSCGKTSTKDLIAAMLSEKYKVFKTKGNFNNHIGLPLMILKLDSTYDVAVLEMGMSNLGEIHTLADCARPDIAVITNIGISHIENLKSRENILKAKMEITDFFSDDNVLIVNAEDDYLVDLQQQKYKLIKTGYSSSYNFEGKDIQLHEESTKFTLVDNNSETEFVLPMVGAHNVLNALLAIAVAKELNVTNQQMLAGLNNIENTSMRLEFIYGDKLTIINDCYNASPDSMKAALDVLKNAKGARKVAILGTMNELGKEAPNAHTQVGAYAKEKVDLLIVTGSYKDNYKNGFDNTNIKIYNTKEELIKDLNNIIIDDDVILVKASRGIKYEEIVNKLKEMIS